MAVKKHMNKGWAGLVATAASMAMLGAVSIVPANAVNDVNADVTEAAAGPFATQAVDDTVADAMPDNPNAALPDKVAASITDDDTVVSEDYAVNDSGELKNIETGETVTDTKLVGTESQQPDPLAKTDGESFIPVPAEEVKQKVEKVKGADAVGGDTMTDSSSTDSPNDVAGADGSNGATDGEDDTADDAVAGTAGTVSDKRSAQSSKSAQSTVKLASLQNNDYGAHWGTYNDTAAFFNANNSLFVQQAKGVIDVSVHQGTIDWQAAKNAGVEGAIIRISYGSGNGLDGQALRNINECKRLGIPFGIYTYSYAYDSALAADEGNDIVSLLRQAGVNPGDLSYPVFYDLEHWTWTGHSVPTDPNVYEGIVNTWYSKLKAAGYTNLGVYSYTSYLNSALNKASIHAKTRWVAQYGGTMGFTNWSTNDRGWQYTSGGSIAGISGRVDLNAFGTWQYDSKRDDVIKTLTRVDDIAEGDYYLGSALAGKYIEIAGGSTDNLANVVIGKPTNGSNQLFHIKPVGKGAYTIVSKASGKAIDIEAASMKDGASIIQFDSNGGDNQKWFFYRNSDGYVYIVSAYGDVHNKVLDVAAGNTAEGTRLELWTVNGGLQQQFRLMQKVQLSGNQSVSSVYSSGKTLDVKAASVWDAADIDVWTSSGGLNQSFLFEDKGNGLFAIKAVHSNKYLDIYGADAGDGGRVIQYRWTGASNQLWYLQGDRKGDYAILSLLSNKALDIKGMSKDAGAAVITYRYKGQENQKWSIKQSTSRPASINWSRYGKKSADVVDGDYFLESALTGHYVSTMGNKVVIGRAKNNANQLYQIKKNSNDTYTLISRSNGKALAVSSTNVVNGDSPIWQDVNASDSHQQWHMYKTSNGLYYITPVLSESNGKVLDVPAMNTKDGTELDLWGINGGSQQRFRLLQQVKLDGTRVISSDFARGNRLDIKAMSPYPGAEVDTWTPTKGRNQRFSFVSKGNGLYAIKARHSGLLLDIRAMADADGATVIQYPWTGGNRNQLWYLQGHADGSYTILSSMNDKALDIYGMQTTPGGHIITYRNNGQGNQHWRIEKE
ncbi:RICIN domain-containing protein [Bifidobacterium cebidarum]|uniref:Glycosyl hydrolase family 25,lysozyme n=1 Tax=Bifidobacterium cebidarum TaxID=2650773 RepID=A0A6I1GIK4_9BIFI|nr:RICIN domain-containing protein [Bifidobacterium cebidarum]KAB7786812.1 Glycosyl hydrolase family 25,lysozyme [Bifidobacterium cebidarum]